MKRPSIIWPTLFLFLLLGVTVPAEETADEENFDALFDEPMTTDSPDDAGTEQNPSEEFLVSESIEWGGRLQALVLGEWTWQDLNTPVLLEPDRTAVNTDLELDLFFDARPSSDFRVFGKFKISQSYDPLQQIYEWDYSVFELFSDFHVRDAVFFRFGKQTVHWGVGYFFSPVDVFNLVLIDPEDPEVEREGPVAFKTQLPLGIHNLYLYLIAREIERPEDIAIAPKGEVVLGNAELSLGGFYQYEQPPRLLLTLTGPLRDVDLFAEAVLQYGSDRTFIRPYPLPPLFQTFTRLEEWFFSGTVGCTYFNSDWNLSLSGQYFFNGQGYEDTSNLSTLVAYDVAQAILLGIPMELSSADLLFVSRHYAGATLNWSAILDSDFGLSLSWLGNLQDGSGWLAPTVFWNPQTTVRLSTSLRYSYGREGSEYTPFGDSLGLSIEASLGGGRF